MAAASDPSFSPTMTHAATQAGLILGTAAYMSPEQARGKAVDKRADIWAFGVVLWEILTGRRLFGGETVSDVMAGVLRAGIDLDALPEGTPPAVCRVLRRCLERDPRSRLHDIADARIEIEQATRETPEPATVLAATIVRGGATSRERLAWALVAIALLTAVIAVGLARRKPAAAAQRTTRFRMLPAEAGTLEGYPALSPDGRTLVYVVARENGSVALCAHSFDSGASRQLPGTDDAQEPFFSPTAASSRSSPRDASSASSSPPASSRRSAPSLIRAAAHGGERRHHRHGQLRVAAGPHFAGQRPGGAAHRSRGGEARRATVFHGLCRPVGSSSP